MSANNQNNEESTNLLMSVAKERQAMYNTINDKEIGNVKVTNGKSTCSEVACLYFSITLVMIIALTVLIYIYK